MKPFYENNGGRRFLLAFVSIIGCMLLNAFGTLGDSAFSGAIIFIYGTYAGANTYQKKVETSAGVQQ